jgi:hypothetical protein
LGVAVLIGPSNHTPWTGPTRRADARKYASAIDPGPAAPNGCADKQVDGALHGFAMN